MMQRWHSKSPTTIQTMKVGKFRMSVFQSEMSAKLRLVKSLANCSIGTPTSMRSNSKLSRHSWCSTTCSHTKREIPWIWRARLCDTWAKDSYWLELSWAALPNSFQISSRRISEWLRSSGSCTSLMNSSMMSSTRIQWPWPAKMSLVFLERLLSKSKNSSSKAVTS